VPYITSGDIKIYYEEKGAGPPLLFLHGFSLDHRMWRDQVDYFSDKYSVITYDARGHGQSDAPESGYSRENRVDDLLALIDALKLQQFHLVGLSMGGGDALRFALDYQERLKTLTLAGSTASGWKAAVQMRDFPFDEEAKEAHLSPADLIKKKGIDQIKRQWIDMTLAGYDKRNQGLKQPLAEMMQTFSGKPWTDPDAGNYEKRDDIRLAAKIRIPTFIIVGQRDIVFRPLAAKLSEIILDADLEIVKDAGHMVNLEAPELFNNFLEKFLLENESKK
jgi:3-oxoadipate enol-lactonase